MAFPAATARFFLFLFNVVFLVTGIAVAVTAILIELSFSQHSIFIEEKLGSPPVIIAIACGVICLVAIFGCCGVIKESRCILFSFSGLLIIVFVVEVVAGIYAYQTSDVIGDGLLAKMHELQNDYGKTNATVVRRSWDVLQSDFHCCGIKEAEEWIPILNSNSLPHSCCSTLPIERNCTLADASKQGCFTLFEEFLQSKACFLAAIAIGVGVAQLLCSIASGLLARHINKQYEAV